MPVVKPRPIRCLMERGIHNVRMGNPGAFWVDRMRKKFYMKIRSGAVLVFDLNRWMWDGDWRAPNLSAPLPCPAQCYGSDVPFYWNGAVRNGDIIEP